jgi:hypothetical protein
MVWPLLLLIAAIVAVHWWEYRYSVQEYTFAQPATLDRHDELRGVLSEKTPVAVEIGALPWRPEVAEKSAWTVTTEGSTEASGLELDMSVSQWVMQKPRPALLNTGIVAEEMALTTGLDDIDASRAWWWMPGLYDAQVDVLQPGDVLGLKWIGAERHWIGCSHGGPLTLWLVHSRYHRYLPETSAEEATPINPWTLTVSEAPWIGRVQYIEVTVKPGWCIGLPAHWGFAVRCDSESWWWSADQHSPLSWCLSNMDRIPLRTEL